MESSSAIDDRRLVLQAELDSAKTQAERNRLGQFATPSPLASDVLAFARNLLPRKEPIRFLDPALGTGSFYAALLREFPARQIAGASGFEIDPHYGDASKTLWKRHGIKITLGDFTSATPPRSDRRANLVICNPPYVRHHHLSGEDKTRLVAATQNACGVRIGGLAGLYCYFLGLTHAWLAPDAISGWLIPSEFMDVNYGAQVKRYLLNQVELLRIHRFDPSDVQFGDALVSSAVVWFRNRRPKVDHTVEMSFGGSLSAPKVLRSLPAKTLAESTKWTGLTTATERVYDGLRLGDFFKIKRGLATGDNRFFIMTRAEIGERKLPMEFFKPILPGPRHLPTDVIEADEDGVPELERQLFILDCRLPEAEVQKRHPQLWEYFATGRPRVSDTYLCRHRRPWYAQEERPAPILLCTYMGRGLEKREKPFRFILNKSRATAANVYLLFYPTPLMAKAMQQKPSIVRKVWEFLNAVPTSTLLGEGRVYGGGLYKLEPRELANVPAEEIASLLPFNAVSPTVQGDMFQDKAA